MGKQLDPLEMTLKKFPHLRKHKQEIQTQPEPQQQLQQDTNHGLQICPNCGARALRLDGGCCSCLSCAWSACHNS